MSEVTVLSQRVTESVSTGVRILNKSVGLSWGNDTPGEANVHIYSDRFESWWKCKPLNHEYSTIRCEEISGSPSGDNQ